MRDLLASPMVLIEVLDLRPVGPPGRVRVPIRPPMREQTKIDASLPQRFA
jgi:hypothetical protein